VTQAESATNNCQAATGHEAAQDEIAPEEAKAEAGEMTAAPHVSVIYVHGIGSQRRYEETSRLIDQIDTWLGNEHRRGSSFGRMVNIKPRIEPLRGGAISDTITYIRTALLPPRSEAGQEQPSRTVRFYEVYWAPILAEAKSPLGVLKWVCRQAWRPLKTLGSPWRERQRLRRASLVSLFKPGVTPPAIAQPGDYNKLVSLYCDFEGLGAQRQFPGGSFPDFLAYIGKCYASKPDTSERLRTLARLWRRTYWQQELRNAFALVSLGLAQLLLAGAVVLLALRMIEVISDIPLFSSLAAQSGFTLAANLPTAASLVVAVAGFLGLGRMLTAYLGDVEAWSTYEETDEKHVARGKIMAEAIETISHVLCDSSCERAIVVAHSLGTSIAHDALLALTRRNRATNAQDPILGPVPLDKIEHFVTLGSPIDKIEYFFESYASASHRYKRVIEELRGDVGTPPFSRNRKPHIHWVNFWDLGDPVSGSLDSPASEVRSAQFIDNVAVASYDFPAPARSHAGYFEHADVIEKLFRMIFWREWSFCTLPSGPAQPPDYLSLALAPGEVGRSRLAYLLLAGALPWMALLALLVSPFEALEPVMSALAGLFVADLAILGSGFLAGSRHRRPI